MAPYGSWPQAYPQLSPYAQMPQQSATAPTSNLTWVVGRAGADAYVTAPNTTVLLMDSTADTFYLKETDATGRASVTTCDFTRREERGGGEYATRADLEALKAEILEAVNGEQPVQASHLAPDA